MSKKLKAAVSHHEREVAELRADRELVVEYLKAAMESLDNPDDRAATLLALRTVAKAYGGLSEDKITLCQHVVEKKPAAITNPEKLLIDISIIHDN